MDDLTRSRLGNSFQEYQEPLLATVFHVGGWITVATSLVGIVYAHQIAMPLLVDAAIAASGVLGALVYFGMAQLTEHIARIEFHASQQRDEQICFLLAKIEKHLSSKPH